MAIKPRIQYKDTVFLPSEITQKPLIRRRDGINWADKAELTDYVDSLYVAPTSDTYLQAICKCGLEYSYTTKEDVPDTDFDCSCGREIFEYINV